jgi:pimeloyl-ACP methyl ester carboxylesterase
MSAGAVVCGPPDAPAVLLIHGLGGSPRVWDRVVPLIHTTARVYAAHLDPTRSIEKDADAVAALIDTPTLIVGHSRGGLVATAIAERQAALVRKLILICPPWSLACRLQAKAPTERALAIPGLGDVLWALASSSRVHAALQSTLGPNTPVPDQFVRDLRARGRRTFTDSSRAIDNYLGDKTLADRLMKLEVPTELTFGELDARIARPGHEFARVPSAQLTVLPGIGHTPPWEAPERVAGLIRSSLPEAMGPRGRRCDGS